MMRVIPFVLLCLACVEPDVEFKAPSLECTSSVRDVSSLEDRALCEGETLLAELTTSHEVEVPFEVATRERLATCFIDDDGEHHEATLSKNGRKLLTVYGDGPCEHEVVLDPGRYVITLKHVDRGADGFADHVFTRWSQRGDVRRLNLTVNACQGCNLSNVTWPLLGIAADGSPVHGFIGDYTGASFSGSSCVGAATCMLGRDGKGLAAFSRIKGTVNVARGRLNTDRYGTANVELGSDRLSEFAGADLAFHIDVTDTGRRSIRLKLAGEFAGASVRIGAAERNPFSLIDLTQGARLDDANIAGARFAVAPSKASVVGSFKAAFIGPLLRAGAKWTPGNELTIVPGDNLEKFVLDGRVDTLHWKDQPAATEPFSFTQANLSNLRLPCQPSALGSGAFAGTSAEKQGASFAGAVLRNVVLSDCNLSYTDFSGASLEDVKMVNASLLGTLWHQARIDGLDLTRATLLDTGPGSEFAPISPISGVTLTNATFSLRVASGRNFLNFNAFTALLQRADFSNTNLKDANFQGSTLSNALFVGANLTGANLMGVLAESTNFRQASLDHASLRDGMFDIVTNFAPLTTYRASLDRAFFCGGVLPASQLSGASLNGATFAFQEKVVRFQGADRRCGAFAPFAGGGSSPPITSMETKCPNGSMGPCVTTSQWSPP